MLVNHFLSFPFCSLRWFIHWPDLCASETWLPSNILSFFYVTPIWKEEDIVRERTLDRSDDRTLEDVLYACWLSSLGNCWSVHSRRIHRICLRDFSLKLCNSGNDIIHTFTQVNCLCCGCLWWLLKKMSREIEASQEADILNLICLIILCSKYSTVDT